MAEETTFIIACPHCQTDYRVALGIAGKKVTCKRCQNVFTAAAKNSPFAQPSRLGQIALKYNLITPQQYKAAVAAQQKSNAGGTFVPMAALLQAKGWLTTQQIASLQLADQFWRASQAAKGLGLLAIEKGLITQADLDQAMKKQADLFKESKTVVLVKDILRDQGKLSAEQMDMLITTLNTLPHPAPDRKTDVAPQERKAAATEVDRYYELTVTADKREAVLEPKEDRPPTLSTAAVLAMVAARGITHGIVEPREIENYLAGGPAAGAPLVIARATPPVAGTDARIRYHFSTGQKVGTISNRGNIDFKDKGEIPFVQQGALLMEKTPAGAGTPGTDVTGAAIPAPQGKDVKLLVGSGTELSEDKTKVFAKTDGQPKLSLGGRLSVISDLTVTGDVDLKSGHIDFDGNVKVTGTVQAGFRVKCANLTAKEIMGAEITATGDVTVTGGIIGAVVKAQGSIKAKYVKNASLSTFGDVTAEKEITDATIDTSGVCRVTRGKIINSEISAKQGIEAVDIGTDMSAPCRLTVGVDDHVEAELEGIHNAIARRTERKDQLLQNIAQMENQQHAIHKKIADLAQVQDRSLVEQRSLAQAVAALPPDDRERRAGMEDEIQQLLTKAGEAEEMLGGLFDKQDRLTEDSDKAQTQIDQIDDDIAELRHEVEAIRHWAGSQKRAATVKVSQTAVQGTHIAGPHSRLILKDNYRHITVREVKNTDPDSALEWEIKIQ